MGLSGKQGTPVPILADSDQTPPTEGSQLLRQQLARLLEEMRRAQEELREKIEQDILPRLQEEIEKLQEMLKEYRSDEKARSIEI
jgi:DNA-binding transcriptional MerR regulator